MSEATGWYLLGNGYRSANVTAVDHEVSEDVTELEIPASEVKPEDIGTLSLRYVDGVPQLVVSGGTVIPAGLTVVDGSGNAVAAYAAGPFSAARDTRGVMDFFNIMTYDMNGGWSDK